MVLAEVIISYNLVKYEFFYCCDHKLFVHKQIEAFPIKSKLLEIIPILLIYEGK